MVGGPPTLYMNADLATARANVRRFLAPTPFAPEDLVDDRGYALVDVTLPEGQRALDVVTDTGVTAAGLPATYPLDGDGAEIAHTTCQPIGQDAFDTGLDGVSCRSAAQGTELAWFPRTRHATRGRTAPVRGLVLQLTGQWWWAQPSPWLPSMPAKGPHG